MQTLSKREKCTNVQPLSCRSHSSPGILERREIAFFSFLSFSWFACFRKLGRHITCHICDICTNTSVRKNGDVRPRHFADHDLLLL